MDLNELGNLASEAQSDAANSLKNLADIVDDLIAKSDAAVMTGKNEAAEMLADLSNRGKIIFVVGESYLKGLTDLVQILPLLGDV